MNIKYENNYSPGQLLFVTVISLLFSLKVIAADTSSHSHSVDMEHATGSMEMPNKMGQSDNYACPMHPEVTSNKPDSCSKCGMFLVKQDQHTATTDAEPMKAMKLKMEIDKQHDHDKLYACPMHPEETSDKPGSCSKCGMFLVKQESASIGAKMNMEKMHTMNHQPSSSGMQHGKMQMQQQAKPSRYWETISESANPIQHDHTTDAKPVAQRMKPEIPTISGEPDRSHGMSEAELKHAAKHLDPTYICPMHPQIVQHEPGGNCPICGMNLVAKEMVAPTGDSPQVFLPAAVIQNMGIRTETVQLKAIDKKIQTQGRVTADDDRIFSIHSRTAGWVEVLHLVTEGDRVERKDELVDFFSPWVNRVQMDYISALEEYDLTSFDPSRKVELGAKVDTLRNSLRLLNVMDMDIMRIRNNRKVQNTIQMLAPQGGIITKLNINEGSYVEPYDSMFTIVDLSQVWVMVDIYEHQAPWVRKGNKVEITAPAIAGRSWQGVVDFIYPSVDPKTRTLRARIVVPNPDEALLLNMFVKVNISSDSANQAVLSVPREAVIITGERESVIKVLDKGHFQPVEVSTGKRGDGSIEILSGLHQGDRIVTSGQFLIDSESSLQASFLRMSE